MEMSYDTGPLRTISQSGSRDFPYQMTVRIRRNSKDDTGKMRRFFWEVLSTFIKGNRRTFCQIH